MRVKAINANGLILARCDKEGIYEFTRLDRTGYKMIIVQLLENLNYMCAVFQHKKIKMENPTRQIKKDLMDYYH